MVTLLVTCLLVSDGSRQLVDAALAESGQSLAADVRLDAAARCLLERSVESGRLASPMIRHCAQTAGVFDNLLLPAMVMHRGARGLVEGLGPFVRGEAKKRGITHCGSAVAIHDGWAHLLMLGTQRRGELFVEPEAQDPGETLMFHGALSVSHQHPRALLSSPRGAVYPVPLTLLTDDRRTFVGSLRLPKEPGRYQLEIIGDSSSGPTVVANRALYVGVGQPLAPEPREIIPGDPVQRMLTLINESRAAHGLPALMLDNDLSAVAELHALAMRQASHVETYFGHDSPDKRSTLAMRLWGAKIRYSEAAENIAESATVEDAHETLMSSPGHRDSILHPRFRSVGIGYVRQRLSTGDESILVVVDFTRPAE